MLLVDKYGPWAVIAGASEGTGKSFAQQLAASGINCVLIARREELLNTLATEIREDFGVECLTLAIDLSSEQACERIIETVGSREVGLYISNAGADPHGAKFLEKDAATWHTFINRNIVTNMHCCHHFAAAMRERGRGGILLVGSGACYGGGSFLAIYTACKAFDLCFAESLWAELRTSGVDVLYLVLSMTDTPALHQLLHDKGQAIPEGLASPDAVAREGLSRLSKGPVHNYGQDDTAKGFGPSSPQERRERIVFIDEMSKVIFGDND